MQTIKGRTIEVGQKVKVHYNLHKHLFSVTDMKTNLVVGHSESVQLVDVVFKVSEKGRQRVLRDKKKNVHAYAVGVYVGCGIGDEDKQARYDPYKFETFVMEDGQPIYSAKSVTCKGKQVSYS